MVIEDNPTDVFLVKKALKTHGLTATLQVLEDGEEAIHLVAHIDATAGTPCPDLIILDINLPKTDGFRVLEYLRQSRKCAQVPVIVMTSSEALVDRMKASELAANAYFQKPTGYDAFLKIGIIIQALLREE